ncbi:MFS transporter [Streptococcaceae bacterium ESL0687]|nr:MFS transporter [Streptococcaceae bacterium ESL0687]
MKKDNYFKLLVNRILYQVGSVTYDYANSVWIASMGSLGQKYLGIYQMSETLISIFFNPIAGAVADRFKRKKIILFTDLVSFFACLLISLIGDDRLMLYGIVVANIILAIMYSFASTAFKSLIPNAIEKSKILSFNSVLETIMQVFSVLSPLMSFYIYNSFGIRATLLVTALSFLACYLVMLTVFENTGCEKEEEVSSSLQSHPSHQSNQEKASIKRNFAELLEDIKDGLKYIKSDKRLFELLVTSAFVNFFISFYNYLMPFSNQIFGDQEFYSKLLTFGAIGSILGAICAKFLPNTRFALLSSLGLSGLGIAIIAAPSFISSGSLISYLGNLIFMFFLTIYNIHFVSSIQSKVADDYLGRVFSTVFTIAILFMPFGTALITLIPQAVHSLTFILVGLAIFLLAVVSILLGGRENE